MTTENPFEVSELCTGANQTESPLASSSSFRVEGDILVCGKTVVLPPVCAFRLTNENLVAKTAAVQYGSFRLVLMQRTCSVTYSVCKEETRGASVLNVVGIIAAICIAFLLTGKFRGWDEVFAMGVLISLVVTMAVQFRKRKESVALVLDRYDSPGIYRIRGFSRQYLDTISHMTPPDDLTTKAPLK